MERQFHFVKMRPERRADAERNQATVLRTTIALLREFGPSVTIDQIAERSGLGAGTVMRSFGSKSNLFDAAISESLRPVVARVSEPVPDAEAAERLRELLVELAAYNSEHRVMAMALTCAGLGLKRMSAACAEVLERISALFMQAQKVGSVRPDLNPTDVTTLLHSIGQVGERFDARQQERFVTILMDGICCRTAFRSRKPTSRGPT
jgi:AcrR family transcriptional regulator